MKIHRGVLIYAPGSLGDTLMICPALEFIKKQQPRQKISLLYDLPMGRTKLTPKEILGDTSMVDGFVEYSVPQTKNWFSTSVAGLKLFCKLFLEYHTVFYLVECWRGERRALRDKVFFALCGITCFKYFDRLLDRPKPDAITVSRAVEALFRAGDDDALKISSEQMSYRYIQNLAINTLVDAPSNVCHRYVLSPFSNMPAKDWPTERYILLAKFLKEKFKVEPVIFGSHDDIDSANNMIKAIGFGKSLCGLLSFQETRNEIRKCSFYVGNDSGLMHLSAALELPCFSIFSARDFKGRWIPLGNLHTSLRTTNMECEGCRVSICTSQYYNGCLRAISVTHCQVELNQFIQKNRCEF